MVNCEKILSEYKESLLKENESWPFDVKIAHDYLCENLFKCNCNIFDMMSSCRINSKNFSTRFKYYTGLSPSEFLRLNRLKASLKIISNEKMENVPIGCISIMVGYENPASFSNSFKRQYGISPKEYRKGKRQVA